MNGIDINIPQNKSNNKRGTFWEKDEKYNVSSKEASINKWNRPCYKKKIHTTKSDGYCEYRR